MRTYIGAIHIPRGKLCGGGREIPRLSTRGTREWGEGARIHVDTRSPKFAKNLLIYSKFEIFIPAIFFLKEHETLKIFPRLFVSASNLV